MTAARILLAAIALAAAPSAQAQIAPPRAGSAADLHRYQGEQHRAEIDRLRVQAAQREAFARQLELETGLSRLEIEAARQTDITQQPEPRALRSPAEERALRESATRRRQAAAAGVGEIDAWLDRPAR
jgi:hypothetical protein